MQLIRYTSPRPNRDGVLLILLPGVGIQPTDFAAHGLVEAVQNGHDATDVVAAGPELDLYFDGDIAHAIQREIVAPAKDQGYRRIWILGLSLGGMGALLHASRFPDELEGIVLLAPYLGTPGNVAEIISAGGLALWNPRATAANDSECRLLLWLKDKVLTPSRPPLLYLGYGRSDRFAEGHAMLADQLPANRVIVRDGHHDWTTWISLWQELLALRPLTPHGSRHCPSSTA